GALDARHIRGWLPSPGAGSGEGSGEAVAHLSRVHTNGPDFIGYARFLAFAVGVRAAVVFVSAGVLVGEHIDDFQPGGFVRLGDFPAHFEPAIRVFRVDGENRRFATLLKIEVLLAATRRVDDDVRTVVMRPDRCRLWLAVRHHRDERDHDGFGEQILVRFRYRAFRHQTYSLTDR